MILCSYHIHTHTRKHARTQAHLENAIAILQGQLLITSSRTLLFRADTGTDTNTTYYVYNKKASGQAGRQTGGQSDRCEKRRPEAQKAGTTERERNVYIQVKEYMQLNGRTPTESSQARSAQPSKQLQVRWWFIALGHQFFTPILLMTTAAPNSRTSRHRATGCNNDGTH